MVLWSFFKTVVCFGHNVDEHTVKKEVSHACFSGFACIFMILLWVSFIRDNFSVERQQYF